MYMCVSRSVMSNFCNPMDYSPPGSSVHRILQARILEWVAIPFSRESSWLRDWTCVSHIVGRFFTIWITREDNQCKWAYYNCSNIWTYFVPRGFLGTFWGKFRGLRYLSLIPFLQLLSLKISNNNFFGCFYLFIPVSENIYSFHCKNIKEYDFHVAHSQMGIL